MTMPWVATYRLQLHSEFTLDDAIAVLPYLADLGISHAYLSPCLQANPGSQHGYDVADPRAINTDLGGEAAWSRFVSAARDNGLRVLLDIVPNHMAASEHNPWWDDVLAHGPYSEYAQYFDIKVAAGEAFRVHLCSLGKPYGETLQSGDLKIELVEDQLRVKHFDNSWPLSPSAWAALLGATDDCFSGLENALNTPVAAAERVSAEAKAGYSGRVAEAKKRLGVLIDSGELPQIVARVNADLDHLDRVLSQQFYALHYWKLAGELINYRRFFDVSTLVGISTERAEVFEAAHSRYKAMIAAREIDGLRIDHPDGLRDPLEYFKRLREILPDGRIYVEKILDNEEKLNEDWPIDGTVGYDFLAKVNRLWMSDQRTDSLTATYADFTGHSVNLGALIREKKDYIVGYAFANEHLRLTRETLRIARESRATRDLSPRQLHDAWAQITAALGIYRLYRTADGIHAEDKRVFLDAVQSARIRRNDIDAATYDFFQNLVTQDHLNEAEAALVAQWQQLTPAVMAKGVEDTTFYCFDRLLSCNEVGAQASLIGISADKFHEYCHHLSERWPNNQLATSTHDNKRSEDVRTRISVLSEIPDRWSEALHAWALMNEPAWNNRTPDRHAEYLLYQTLIGAWPIDNARTWAYMLKASREAKMRTSWQEPNLGYEENIKGFVARVLESPEFIRSLEAFIEPLIAPGRINSLAQTLVKLVAPGVPDFYQGTELWDLSLVDPDNRRPVDYAERRQLMARVHGSSASDVMREWDSGLIKLWMTHRVLKVRAERPELFAAASKYQPLVAQGDHLGNLLAFRRGEQLIAVVPRLTVSIGGEWGDTTLPLPGGPWRNVFTDQTYSAPVSPQELFSGFPVALLLKETAETASPPSPDAATVGFEKGV